MTRSRWVPGVMLAIGLLTAARPLAAQESTDEPGPVAIGVGVERFGVVLARFADAGDGLFSSDFGLTMPSFMVSVPISSTFAVQANLSTSQRTEITGEYNEFLYGFMVNQRLRLGTRTIFPYLTYGLVGIVSNLAVPESTEWYWNGAAWEERSRAAYTQRSHQFPGAIAAGAGIQYNVWRGIAVRAEAELMGPSAARVRTNVVIPIGR